MFQNSFIELQAIQRTIFVKKVLAIYIGFLPKCVLVEFSSTFTPSYFKKFPVPCLFFFSGKTVKFYRNEQQKQ